MIGEIFRRILDLGYITMDQINLIVLDECHWTYGKHPYSRIMEHYSRSNKTTRIFGESATS